MTNTTCTAISDTATTLARMAREASRMLDEATSPVERDRWYRIWKAINAERVAADRELIAAVRLLDLVDI